MQELLFLFVYAVFAQSRQIACSKSEACYPWDPSGPVCGRGNRMNLRFSLEITRENVFVEYQQNVSEIAFAFCPVVDELQAFNLSSSGRYQVVDTLVNVSESTPSPNSSSSPKRYKLSPNHTEAWLYAYGFGGNDNILYPNKSTSEGAVLILDNISTVCPMGEIAYANFLVLSATTQLGRFVYRQERNQPLGVGFVPTCDSDNLCLFDRFMKCIGPVGRRNCATCYSSADDIAVKNIQIWMSFEGTDRFGRQMRSSSSNPLKFRAFSGIGAYTKVLRSVEDLRAGRITSQDIEPQ